MFYTDELRRLRPLAWLVVASLAGWAVMFYLWPRGTGVFVAIVAGVILSFGIKYTIEARIRNRIQKNEGEETDRRADVRKRLDELGERRDRRSEKP